MVQALVNVTNVIVLDNPTHVRNPFQFDITFECLQELPEDLEFRLTYVGNAEDTQYDQLLEEVLVGPLVMGINRFVLQAPPPDLSKIANEDLIGVTVCLISCFYQNKEFLKIGYYVANEYMEEFDPENPPNPVNIDLLRRNIAADQPRVTRIPINWYAGHDENIAYCDAETNANEEEGAVVDFNAIGNGENDEEDGDDMDGEGDGEEDIDQDLDQEAVEEDINIGGDEGEIEDMDMMSGGEDSMDVANMQHLIRSESN